jgi:hypothetical protein
MVIISTACYEYAIIKLYAIAWPGQGELCKELSLQAEHDAFITDLFQPEFKELVRLCAK